MKTLLITGPIGSGKSLASRMLVACGLPVYDCDAQAKDLYRRHPALIEQLEKALGQSLRKAGSKSEIAATDSVLGTTLADSALDKKKLAALLFASPEARRTVNALVHPLVIADFLQWSQLQKGPWVGMESALLLSPEAGATLDCDAVLYVDAPVETRLARILQRDACTREQALSRIASQALDPRDARISRVLVNDGDASQFEQQVKAYYKTLLEK